MPKAIADRERTGFGLRMQRSRKAAGLTQKQVEKQLDVAQSTLTELESTSESTGKVVQFAVLYGVDPLWLATGSGRAPDWWDVQHAPTGMGMRPVAHPVSHQKREAAPPFTPWEQLLNSPLEAEFQTEAPDASMAPDVPAGARVIFITDAVAEPGDFVLVRDKHGNVYIREFKQVRPGHWQAWAKNRAFLPLDNETDGLEVLAVCDGVRGRMSRRLT